MYSNSTHDATRLLHFNGFAWFYQNNILVSSAARGRCITEQLQLSGNAAASRQRDSNVSIEKLKAKYPF